MLKLRELRAEKNVLQKDIAKIVNKSAVCVGDWERGRVEPSIEDLIKLSVFFDCSIGYLVGVEDESGRAVPQELSEREKKILKLFGSLTELEQDKLIADAEFYAGRHSSGITPKRIG